MSTYKEGLGRGRIEGLDHMVFVCMFTETAWAPLDMRRNERLLHERSVTPH